MECEKINPFGHNLQRYWDARYELFSLFDKGIQTDEEGLFSITPERIAVHQAEKMKCRVVLDGFCGVGGNTIAFAKTCRKVYAVDINKKRLEMAKHNSEVYGVSEKIEFIEGDFFEKAESIKADGAFLSPPWGGPEYKKLNVFKLSDFKPNGEKIIEVSFENFEKTALYCPKNIDLEEIKSLGMKFEVEKNELKGKEIAKTIYFF